MYFNHLLGSNGCVLQILYIYIYVVFAWVLLDEHITYLYIYLVFSLVLMDGCIIVVYIFGLRL